MGTASIFRTKHKYKVTLQICHRKCDGETRVPGRELRRREVDRADLLRLRPALLHRLEVRHEAPLVAAKLLWVEVARLLGDVYDRGKVLEPKHYMEILILGPASGRAPTL